MREISGATVSSKSPRQMISSSCLRTAGVGSTGTSVAAFIASKSRRSQLRPSSLRSVTSFVSVASVRSPGRVSSSVAFVASASSSLVASVASRPGALRIPGNEFPSVSRRVVASVGSRRGGNASEYGGVSPKSLLAASFAQVASVACVASGVELREFVSRRVAFPVAVSRSVECSPRRVLGRVFSGRAEAARDMKFERMSRRFSSQEVSERPVVSRECELSVSRVSSELSRLSPVEVVSCRTEADKPWRVH